MRSRVFSLEKVPHEMIEVYAQPDTGGAEAGGGRDCGAGSVPGAWCTASKRSNRLHSQFSGKLMGEVEELAQNTKRFSI